MTIKNIEKKGNEATVVVEIDKELMESGVNKAFAKARKNIMIPGFRKGKAPRKMIEAMYGAHVFYEDGLEEIFPEIYKFAIEGCWSSQPDRYGYQRGWHCHYYPDHRAVP